MDKKQQMQDEIRWRLHTISVICNQVHLHSDDAKDAFNRVERLKEYIENYFKYDDAKEA